MSLLEWMCGNLDFEDGSTAPFSAAALEPEPPPWFTATMAQLVNPGTALKLLGAIVQPSPLPPIGPIIVPSEPPIDEPE
jgi:hypothetical protein